MTRFYQAGALALSVSLLTLPAYGDDSSVPEPLAAAIERSSVASDRDQWRFTMSIDTSEAAIVASFDGEAEEGAQWVLLSPDNGDLSEAATELWNEVQEPDEEGDGSLFFSPDETTFVPGSIILASEHADGLTYSFAPLADEADEEEAMFMEYLRGEISITPGEGHVRSVRIFAPESFKPHFAVRVQAFELVQEYQMFDGVPAPVLTRISQSVAGSAAFQNFEEDVEIEFRDIEYLGR